MGTGTAAEILGDLESFFCRQGSISKEFCFFSVRRYGFLFPSQLSQGSRGRVSVPRGSHLSVLYVPLLYCTL